MQFNSLQEHRLAYSNNNISNESTFDSDPKPVITTHPSSAHVLAGQHYKLQVKATGRQPLTYLWYKDGQPVLNSNSSTKEIRLFGEQDVGSYVCKVTNPYGDDISEVAELTIGKKREFGKIIVVLVHLTRGKK